MSFASKQILRLKPRANYIQCRNHDNRKPVPWLGFTRNVLAEDTPGLDDLSLEDIMTKKNYNDPELTKTINIGVPYVPPSINRKAKIEIALQNRRNAKLEVAARHQTLKVDLDTVQDDWLTESWPMHSHRVAHHCGIFKDLFNHGFFVPTTQLKVAFDAEDDTVVPVYMGNLVPHEKTMTEPYLDFITPEGQQGKYNTLIMTNPDGHLKSNDLEYLHWFVSNIPGSNIEEGEIQCEYLPPAPPRGTGYHRAVFVLFTHDNPIDFTSLRVSGRSNLDSRTFSTCEFYRTFQNDMTPVGLSFFHVEWAPTVKDVYHNILDMKEPSYEYMHPPTYFPKQLRYPGTVAFNRYFDSYRDKKDLAEEVMRIKLDMISPFKPYQDKYKYPAVHDRKIGMKAKDYKWGEAYVPSWLLKRKDLMHRRLEQFKILPKEKEEKIKMPD